MTLRDPCLVEPRPNGDEPVGDLVDRYVDFVAARCRPNTVTAARSDLGVFFSVIDKPPVAVSASDVLEFIAAQRRPVGDGKVVRLADGESGLSARTIKRRVATVSGFFSWLTIVGAVTSNPVPRGLSTRRRGRRSGVPLVRTPRTLPKVLDPAEVNVLLGALRRGGVLAFERDHARGGALSEDGQDYIVRAAGARAGLVHATCHELRHTCLTRLREAGMALEAVQAQAGHRSIESTRIYLHLANDWLAGEYLRAVEAIDATIPTAAVTS